MGQDHGDKLMVIDQYRILDHRTDMTQETLIGMNSMMIDVQTIDLEVVICSTKINMTIPDMMVIGMVDHKVIHLKDTITENTMVMKIITPHENSGRTTKIETKKGLSKTTTTNMVIDARIEVIAVVTIIIEEITIFNLEISTTMAINRTITIIIGQENHNCQMCLALLHKNVQSLKINHKCYQIFKMPAQNNNCIY